MAETLGKAVLELVGNIAPLTASLEAGKVEAEKMASTTASGFKAGIQKAAIPAAAAVAGLVFGIHKSIDAAEADQVAQARLAAAYKTAGLNADHYKGSIDGAVRSSADLGFHSSDVKQSLGSLIVATKDQAKALNLLGVAQDIARFKGIGLTDASKMLTMAMAGSQRASKQLGLSVQAVTQSEDQVKKAFKDHTSEAYKLALANAKIIDKQKTTAEVVDLVKEKLHGQAAAYAETGAGMKDKMGAQLNLLEISLGQALLPALEAVEGALVTLTGFMTHHADVVKVVAVVVGTLATAILLYTAYVKIAAAAQALWNGVMAANPIGLVVVAIAALVLAFIYAWKHSETFRNIVLGVWHSLRDSAVAFADFFTKTIPHAFESVLNWVKGHWPMIAVFLSGPFAPLVALATNAFGVRSALTGALNAVWNFAKGVWSGLGRVWGAAWSGAWSAVRSVINAMIGGINTLIGAWDSLHFHFGGVSVLGHHIGGMDVGVPQIPRIPLLAEGGIVNRPTLAMIGEAGPEAVVPLGKQGAMGGITVNVSGVVGNADDVAMAVARSLESISRRGTKFNIAVA